MGNGIKIDMWYGDSVADCDRVDIFFSDLDCEYRGNIYKNGKVIGDYVAKDSLCVEKLMKTTFKHLNLHWN